jgi:hypothetical protein
MRSNSFSHPNTTLKAMKTITQRSQVIEAVQALSDESIDELMKFIDYLQYKTVTDRSDPPILDPNKTYEVWTPIDAPDAAQTLMSLLNAEKLTSNV